MIAVRKGLDDKFQHTLLDQEIKDGRIANEEIAKECFESRKFFIDLRERTGQTLNWETKQAYIAMTALLYGLPPSALIPHRSKVSMKTRWINS